MDQEAVTQVVSDWIADLAEADPSLVWLNQAERTAHPAFLTDERTKEGDDYKAGAVPIKIAARAKPSETDVQRLQDAVLSDRTLGDRVKRAIFERSTSDSEAGIIVVIPK